MSLRSPCLCLAIATAACSSHTLDVGSNPDGGSSAAGLSFTPVSAVGAYGSTGQASVLAVLISDKANTCSTVHGANNSAINLQIAADPVTVGSYPVNVSETSSTALFATNNENCYDTFQHGAATAGTITVTAASSSGVSGSYDLTLEAGHLTGSFDATVCPSLPSDYQPDGGLDCTP
jgi:hypothetical protein